MLHTYKNKLVWPNNIKNTNIVIHNDIDGFLSGLFLINKGAKLVGLYDLEKFYFIDNDAKKNFNNHIYIDLDVDHNDVRTFGHHISANLNKNAFNVNHLFSLDVDHSSFFTNKCPLNTIIMLYSLYNQKPKSDREIALLVYADSVILNFEKYKDNVTNWLTVLEQTEILEALENRIETLHKIIDEEITPALSNDFPLKNHIQNLNNDVRKYTQCNNYIDCKTSTFVNNISGLIALTNDFLHLNVTDFPNTFPARLKFTKNYKMTFDKNTGIYTKENIAIKFDKSKGKNLKEALRKIKDNVISHSFTYSDAIQITLKNDVELAYDEDKNEFIVNEKTEDQKIASMEPIRNKDGMFIGYRIKTRSKE